MVRSFLTGKEPPTTPCDRKYTGGEWKGGEKERRVGHQGANRNPYSGALGDEPHLGVWTTRERCGPRAFGKLSTIRSAKRRFNSNLFEPLSRHALFTEPKYLQNLGKDVSNSTL